MESIKVGIREFRAQLPHYLLELGQPLAITRHGETIGYYIPSHEKSAQGDLTSLMAAAEKLDVMLQAAGVDAEEVVEAFNAKRRKSK
jgi:hypothetical protein